MFNENKKKNAIFCFKLNTKMEKIPKRHEKYVNFRISEFKASKTTQIVIN